MLAPISLIKELPRSFSFTTHSLTSVLWLYMHGGTGNFIVREETSFQDTPQRHCRGDVPYPRNLRYSVSNESLVVFFEHFLDVVYQVPDTSPCNSVQIVVRARSALFASTIWVVPLSERSDRRSLLSKAHGTRVIITP